jgi:hypothetical protein
MAAGATSSEKDMQHLFEWACMIVSSRSFCLVDNTGTKYACLAPLADFANHDPYCPNTTFQLGMASGSTISVTPNSQSLSPGLLLQTRSCISQGDEVTINYGEDKSNGLLLEAYGFAVSANLADRLPCAWNKPCRDFSDSSADLLSLDPAFVAVLAARGVHIGNVAAGVHTS